jgi:phosphoserine/homoserine phosphotransferase
VFQLFRISAFQHFRQAVALGATCHLPVRAERWFTARLVKQSIVTLDMEGVLTPEIWIAVAEKTGIPALRRTTRDEPDYDKLMHYRIDLMHQHGITLSKIQEVIGSLSLLPGALDFLNALRTQTQVIILSDTFEQFAQPLLRQMGWPTLFCHRLVVENDQITGYQLRMRDQKKSSVAALQALNYKVIAAGDSFNDTTMLGQADFGILFHAPENVIAQFPQFPPVHDYASLLKLIQSKL